MAYKKGFTILNGKNKTSDTDNNNNLHKKFE